MPIMQLHDTEAQGFTLTSAEVSEGAGVTVALVRRYADLGLLVHQRTRGGIRLFRADAAERVQAILEMRMKRWRGKPRNASAA